MGKAQALWAGLADAVVGVVLAPRCAACSGVLDQPTRGPVCLACWSLIRPLPPYLGDVSGTHLSGWRAAGEYEGSLREIIHAFKYDGRRSLARPLARLMREAAGTVLADASCVVPVPLHPWRHFRRGFNQAGLLASRLELPVVNALWRIRWTRPQSALARDSRRANVRGAFRLSPLLPARTRDRYIAGRAVVLVDDVRTTGATLDACAAVLVQAGAREVRAVSAASRLASSRSTPA